MPTPKQTQMLVTSGSVQLRPAYVRELGTDLLYGWDADLASTLVISGGLVSSWRDMIGGLECVQATGASQPGYSATGFNGRPCLTFDGTDDQLTLAVASMMPAAATSSELWALADQTALVADATVRHIINYGSSAQNGRLLVRAVQSSAVRARAIGTAVTATVLTVDFSGRHYLRGTFDSTTNGCSIDGSALTTAAVTQASANTRMRIGANGASTVASWWQGSIAGVWVTNPLTASKAAAFSAVLAARL